MTDLSRYAEPQNPAPPDSGFALDLQHAALVVTDPQIDFLSPEGVSWPVFGDSISDNDAVAHIGELLQLRKRGVNQVILAGMAANLCVEGHMRELVEQGFEVAVVKDATARARLPEGDGYLAALVNFRFLASAVWTTAQAVAHLGEGEPRTSDLLNDKKLTIEEAVHHGIE